MEKVLNFFDQGGGLLWAILAVSVLMWMLILERYWFFYVQLPRLKAELLDHWRNRSPSIPHFHEQRLKDSLTSQYFKQVFRGLKTVDILTQILPLLGLLGTVSGMIKVFEVINAFGAGNARGMAAGISEALITTMAGLVTALSGLFFAASLESRARHARERFTAQLTDQ
ncbi:MAG: MotA/TolQ/ExbB proton channel family protein [Methylobacter sp.]|uniref:MotA/TolQ/ExbB proton channel family protein n=1 Tax=Methylobacter sp. TaxID=2051955 RepID=UPI0025860024|nr:MotA/TolQ/ExbB proton channel family protein [Methylobacter sp.]MCL7421200.1 MotA/TolQ/ExbB proton channel family protein [Methylobacter sp.]